MTITQIQQILREDVIAAARSRFGVELDQVTTEIPPKTDLGDLAFPVAFELAKKIKQATGEKKNPRDLAETLKAELESIEAIDRIENFTRLLDPVLVEGDHNSSDSCDCRRNHEDDEFRCREVDAQGRASRRTVLHRYESSSESAASQRNETKSDDPEYRATKHEIRPLIRQVDSKNGWTIEAQRTFHHVVLRIKNLGRCTSDRQRGEREIQTTET